MMKEKLELLALARGFTVRKNDEDDYEIECDNCELTAVTDGRNIEYYRTGCSKCYSDYIEIDVEEFLRLKEFCEALLR